MLFIFVVNNSSLILFDMTTTTPACDALYSKSLHSYKAHILQHGDITLSSYCKMHHVLYSGMKRWLNDQQINIMDIRRSLRNSHSESTIQSTTPPNPTTTLKPTSSSIIPIRIHSTTSHNEPMVNVVPKIKITYPTGIIVELEESSQASIKDILSLIH